MRIVIFTERLITLHTSVIIYEVVLGNDLCKDCIDDMSAIVWQNNPRATQDLLMLIYQVDYSE